MINKINAQNVFTYLCVNFIVISVLLPGETVDEEILEVTEGDFSRALNGLVPSVSEAELHNYKVLQQSLAVPLSKTHYKSQ